MIHMYTEHVSRRLLEKYCTVGWVGLGSNQVSSMALRGLSLHGMGFLTD